MANRPPARRWVSARASGGIIARSSLNFVVFGIVLFPHLGNVLSITKAPPARIFKAPCRGALVLHLEFSHSGMARAACSAVVRKREMGPLSSSSKTASLPSFKTFFSLPSTLLKRCRRQCRSQYRDLGNSPSWLEVSRSY